MKFLIIGGGAGGCASALELAKAGHTVVLVEKRDDLLAGSSDDTPCRLGLGFHYIDINTAKKYLRSTITFLKKYPEFVLGRDKDPSHPYLHWRYFVVKDSQFKLSKIDEVYGQLKEYYKELIKEDSDNAVLGNPENFYRPLAIDEFENHVNKKIVITGFETAEQVLDWPRFKSYMINEVEAHPNITVYKNCEVLDVKHSDKHAGFVVSIQKQNINQEKLSADFIVNCAWENVEAINHKAGFFTQPGARTNRLKVIVEIELPANFEANGPVNSMFFCFGPHCSFTNLGNGKGYISYEPVTNIELSSTLELPALSKRLLYNKASEDDVLYYGQEILAGVVKYIPGLKDSKITGAKFGIVKTKGTVDIYSADSDFHKRDYSGVESQQIRWIDNSCMKLLYMLDNAKEVADLAEKHIKIDNFIGDISVNLQFPNENLNSQKFLQHAFKKYTQRYLAINDIKKEDEDKFVRNYSKITRTVIEDKNKLLTEMKNRI